MKETQSTTYITVTIAARRCGLSVQVVQDCIQRGMVQEQLTEAELVRLRRIRRLNHLGVNMPGIEVILHMRRQIEELQAQLETLSAPLAEE